MRTFAITVFLLVLGWSATRPAQAQTAESEALASDAKERARSHFRMGVDFYREKNFRASVIEFQRAYNAYPNYKILYNLGQTSQALQESVAAIDYLTAYLKGGGQEIEMQRREEVELTIARLKARLASLSVSGDTEGAEIFVDDKSVGFLSREKSVQVSSGRHKVYATKGGVRSVESTIDLGAGDYRNVYIEFAEPVQTQVTYVTRNEPVSSTNWPAIATGIATGTLAVGSITMAILTAYADKKYDDERRVKTTKARLEELRSNTNTKALVTDILLGTTVVSAVVSAVLFFTFDGKPSASDKGAKDGIGVGPGGAQLFF